VEASEARAVALERELRNALRQAGLAWMLDEIDRAVAEGRAVVRSRRGEREPFGPEFDIRDAEVTADRYTAKERTQLLIDALRRTLVDAPALADETVEMLSTERTIERLAFVDPASGETRRAFPDESERATARAEADRLNRILEDVERQLRS
jgi:hypothetical protein